METKYFRYKDKKYCRRSKAKTLLTDQDSLLHHICQFMNMEKRVTWFLLKNRNIYSRT